MYTVYVLIKEGRREMFYVKAMAELYQRLNGGAIIETTADEFKQNTMKPTLRLVA
jgi:hypothetical protein